MADLPASGVRQEGGSEEISGKRSSKVVKTGSLGPSEVLQAAVHLSLAPFS